MSRWTTISATVWDTSRWDSATLLRKLKGAGCYAVLQDKKVIYIGSAKQMDTRLMKHRSSMVADHREWCFKIRPESSKGERDSLELLLIARLRPAQNVRIPTKEQARAKKLSAKRRTQIARKAANARWAKREDAFAYNGPPVSYNVPKD